MSASTDRPLGFDAARALSARPEEQASLLDIDPLHLSELLLLSAITAGANLVTLDADPGASPAGSSKEAVCWLVAKRGSGTLAAFQIAPEVAMAAAVRVARLADIDPTSLHGDDRLLGVARRIKVRADSNAGELLVSVTASENGLTVEVRPLSVNGLRPELPRRVQLLRCVKCGALQSPDRKQCEIDGGALADVGDKPDPGGFIGAYRLHELIGEGGMGRVIAGEHAFLGRPVAIKLLRRTIAQEPLAGRRFLREARAASRIRHPSIVEIIDYGLLSDGRPYMVMERLFGQTLQERLDRDGHLEPVAALQMAREIAIALEAAHTGGVIHLDLKPANVVLLSDDDEAPRIKLIDFGAAVRVGAPTGEGTPAYMSPEHACGEPADLRSDLYALGIVLFEMLSGALPFDGPNPLQVLRAQMVDEPPTVTSPHRALPQIVTRLVDRALRKNPEERHQTAADFAANIAAGVAALNTKEWLRWLR